MQITFEEELRGSQHLPYELRESFYEKMRQTVVVVEAVYGKTSSTAGGICVGADGLVLTASHVLGNNWEFVLVRCHGQSYYAPVKVIHNDPKRDLALLRRINDGGSSTQVEPLHEIHFVKFCRHDKITAGTEAFAIGHPNYLAYTFAIGHVSYPAGIRRDLDENTSCLDRNRNKRCVKDCLTDADKFLQSYKPNLHVIQLNDLHGSGGSSGGAVFNAFGHLMGMVIFVTGRFDYCVHVSVLQQFIAEGLNVEKLEGTSSDGPNRKKLKSQQIIGQGHGQGRGRDRGHRQGGRQEKGKGQTVSLTMPITKWENRTSSCSFRLPLNMLHTWSTTKWSKTMMEADTGISTIAHSDLRSSLDGGFSKGLLRSTKSAKKGKDTSDFDAESVPRNNKIPDFYKLCDFELGGDFDPLPFLKLDMPGLNLSDPLKTTENAKSHLSFLSLLGANSAPEALPQIEGYASLDHAKVDPARELYGTARSNVAIDQCKTTSEAIQFHQDSSCILKYSGHNQISHPKLLRSPLHSSPPPPSIPAQTTASGAKRDFLNCLSDPAIRKRLPKYFVERMTRPTIDSSNLSMQKETKPLIFPECKLEVPLKIASKTLTSVKKFLLSSPSLKRKRLEESEMDPESSKRLKATTTTRRGLLGVSSTINKKVDPGTGYEDNFSENESACSKNMVDLQLPETGKSQNLNNGIVEKAAACATKLDDICNMLRKKNEEAKELLARCIVNSNALMMLNHPMYNDKVSFEILATLPPSFLLKKNWIRTFVFPSPFIHPCPSEEVLVQEILKGDAVVRGTGEHYT